MKVYAQKQSQPQKESPQSSQLTRLTIGNQAVPVLSHANAEGHKAAASTPAPTRFAHDFSRIPVHSKAPVRIQTKLKVNAPRDIYEREADHISDQVMRMPEPRLRRECASGGSSPSLNAQAAHGPLLPKPVNANDTVEVAAPSIVHEALSSSGQPLELSTRKFMESRFSHDFSRVRVHIEARAAEAARAVNALAFTVGQNIFFGSQQYAPTSTSGRQLIAHELAHTIQQRSVSQPHVQRQLDKQTDKDDTEDVKESFPVKLDEGTTIRLIINTADPQTFKLKSGLFPKKFTLTSVQKYGKKVNMAEINPNSMALFPPGICKTLRTRGADYDKLTELFKGVPLNIILIKAMEQNPSLGMDIVGNVSISGKVNEKGEVISPFGFRDWNSEDFLGFTKQRADTVKEKLFGGRANVQTFGIIDVVQKNPKTGKLEGMKGYETTRPPNEDAVGVTIFMRIRQGSVHGVRKF